MERVEYVKSVERVECVESVEESNMTIVLQLLPAGVD